MVLRRKPSVLWATLGGAVVGAMVVAFFVFVQSGEAAPQAADKQPSAPVSPKIVGGTDVPDGKYRFIAHLEAESPNGTTSSLCGGTLIDQDSVLTAAHCFNNRTPDINYKVYVGRTDASSTQGEVRDVQSIFIHPSYNPPSFGYDAAVMKLSASVSGINPIDLATAAQDDLEKAGDTATVAGWGNTLANPPGSPDEPNFPDRMQEVTVPIISDADAEKQDPQDFIPSLMIAAGGDKIDSCQGDSGGPLFVGPTQIGIVSFGQGCANGTPGVYAEVNNPSIRSFITDAASK